MLKSLLLCQENQEQLEQFRIQFLGKKGKIQDLFADFKDVAPELRKSKWAYYLTI